MSNICTPFDLLPAPEPCTINPPPDYFYNNVAKHFLKDAVRIMMNGIPIDLSKVKELEATVDGVLDKVANTLANNPIIQEFQILRHKHLQKEFIEDRKSKMRSYSYYLKPFDHKKMEHRSYFMEEFIKGKGIASPTDTIATGKPKWTVKDVKNLVPDYPALQRLLDGRFTSKNNTFAKHAMIAYAKDKAEIYNRSYKHAIANAHEVELPPFNPGSSKQLKDLFAWLEIESEDFSKDTGEPKWDRNQIERIHKTTTDEHIKEFTQAFIDYSFGAIIKSTFIPAFYNYTIDGRLYGNVKLFGAKSFRLTSQNPNLLNLPSTRSIYSSPVKKCFTAPEGYVVLAIDYGALEDRVIASLSRDPNKCSIFIDGLDGHSLNAYGYFKDEIAEYMELTGDLKTDVMKFYELVESGHKELKAIRQKGKPVTFGLSYGAYPPKVAKELKVELPVAEKIFDRYHNELYSGITDYRENYVLTTAEQTKRMHLGLGCYIHTDSPRKSIRTIVNATCQFWSILTLITINKMHELIDEAGLEDEVQCISTIYDSIYYIVKADAETVKWVNDRLVPIMTTDFMENQTIKNEATAEIGLNWSNMEQIPNNASEKHIDMVLQIVENKVPDTHVQDEMFISTYKIDKDNKITSPPLKTIEQVISWRAKQRTNQ